MVMGGLLTVWILGFHGVFACCLICCLLVAFWLVLIVLFRFSVLIV